MAFDKLEFWNFECFLYLNDVLERSDAQRPGGLVHETTAAALLQAGVGRMPLWRDCGEYSEYQRFAIGADWSSLTSKRQSTPAASKG